MKKILFFTRPIAPPWDEGSKNLAWEIARHFDEKNFKLSILTPKNNSDFSSKYTHIEPQRIYSSNQLNALEKIRLMKYFFTLKGGDFDIVHFLFTPRLLTSNLIKIKLKKTKAKSILTIATLSEENYKNSAKLKKILFADKIIAQSNFTFNRLKEADFENVELIFPSIDLNSYRPKEKNILLAKKLGIEKNDFVLLFAGEFTRLDAIDDLIEAMNILKNTSAHYSLIIACRIKNKADAIKKKEIENKIKKLGLEKNIIVLQKNVQLLDYYNLCDLSVFPAQKMAGKFDIPLVLIESMACGKPILSSDLPVLKEFIKDNETGYISPSANPQKLAEKIIEITNNPEKLNSVSQNALAYTKENFDITKNVKKYQAIYSDILSAK